MTQKNIFYLWDSVDLSNNLTVIQPYSEFLIWVWVFRPTRKTPGVMIDPISFFSMSQPQRLPVIKETPSPPPVIPFIHCIPRTITRDPQPPSEDQLSNIMTIPPNVELPARNLARQFRNYCTTCTVTAIGYLLFLAVYFWVDHSPSDRHSMTRLYDSPSWLITNTAY
jgi:hypothetical protein